MSKHLIGYWDVPKVRQLPNHRSVKVFLNGEPVEKAFAVDTEKGYVVALAPAPMGAVAPAESLTWDGVQVQVLVGKVEITIDE
jgi:hypothetical protein